MEIPKEQILSLLRERGQQDQAEQADQQLPDQVDPEQHADLLSRLGIDPQDLLGGLGGKLGL
jgi:predicted PhzF superfamily epimerase YddE/YHI9